MSSEGTFADGLRARLSLSSRRKSTEAQASPSSASMANEQQNNGRHPSIAIASNAERSTYGDDNIGAESPASPTSAASPKSKRTFAWTAARHRRTPSNLSQTQIAAEALNSEHETEDKAPDTKAQSSKRARRNVPSITAQLSNPLEDTLPFIMRYIAATAVVSILMARYIHIAAALAVSAVLSYILRSKLKIAARDASWQKSKAAAEQAHQEQGEGRSESVEWMNAILKTVWPLITQDYFVPFIDLLEDALMQQVPGIVHSCRVEDLEQGTVPLLVQDFTLLDSSPEAFTGTSEPSKPKASNDKSQADQSAPDLDIGDFINLEVSFAYRSPASRKQKTKANKGKTIMSDEEREVMQDEILDADVPTDQIHMLIYMAIGLQKIAAVEVPVWCEVLGIEGKMRLRVQLVPMAPFVGHVAFTFIGMPKIEMSAKPLGRRMVIDAMHLPLISSYVLHSVEAVVNGFISPKSYTMDVASLLDARDGPRNVYSLGVIMVVVHQAFELPAADTNGNSDPFVSISYAKAGKPLFTTRVLLRTRNPIWHEMAIVLVSPDEVRDREQLRLTVYDADRFSVDDPLGKIDISVDKLIKRALSQPASSENASLFETQTEDLQVLRRGKQAEGKLRYSVGFFRLSKPLRGERTASKQQLLHEAAGRCEDENENMELEQGDTDEVPGQPAEAGKVVTPNTDLARFTTPFDRFMGKLGLPLDEKVLQRRKDRLLRVQKLRGMMEGEKQATMGPPNTEWPSGILAFHIHSIDGLGFEPPQRSHSNSKRLNKKPRYTEDANPLGEGSSKMPNSYVQVILNDEPIFRSRTKTLNPRPYINAGSERFVADFKRSRVDFVVRDQRQRESDAILGIVGLELKEVLKNESRLTQWYTISGGLGFGKIRITLLWRSVEVKIPKQLRGWNIGVLEIASCYVGGLSNSAHRAEFERRDARLLFETVGGRAETESIEPRDEYESAEGDQATFGLRWPTTSPIRIAVRQRYPNFVYVNLRLDSRVPGRAHRFAQAVIPLIWLTDDQHSRRRVPLYEAAEGEWQQFEQDVMHSFTEARQDLADSHQPERRLTPVMEDLCRNNQDGSTISKTLSDSLKCIGYLDLSLYFHSGIAPEHKQRTAGDPELRAAYESWITLVDNGQRVKPKKLSAAHRRKLSNTDANSINDGAATSSPMVRQRASSQSSKNSVPHGEDSDEGEMDRDIANDGLLKASGSGSAIGEASEEEVEQDEDGLIEADTPEGRRTRIRTLHRQQRGAAQIKSYRTLEWLKTNAEDGLGRMRRKASRSQQKRIGKIESEGVSHF